MPFTPWKQVDGHNFADIIFEKKYRLKGGGVARITINRPHRLNAFTAVTMDEMAVALDDASHDRSIGVVVVTGAGDKAFCVGGDIAWEATPGEFRRAMYHTKTPNEFIRMCRKPVIAAVKGWCIGGGNHLAYFCDFTIAADNARFGQNGPRVGSPADGFVVAYLNRIVGEKKAREIWMLCRKYSAEQALQMGLINTVVPLDKFDEEVDQWCEEILSLSPDAIEILKASFNGDADDMLAKQGLYSRLMYPDWFEGPVIKDAQQAFLEKREPDFWKYRPRPAHMLEPVGEN